MNEDIKQSGPATDQPWQRIHMQIGFLDRALNTIPHTGSEETTLVRSYLIAQIEALKWVLKMYE